MGFWGGNNSDEDNQLIEQQIQENNANIERERQALTNRRLDIIKSQGAQSFVSKPLTKPIDNPIEAIRRENERQGRR